MMKQIAAALALVLGAACLDQPTDLELDTVDSEVTAVAGGTYQIITPAGTCLDVPGFARDSRVALQAHACKRSGYLGNQQLTFEPVTGGHYRVRAFDSQLCLDLPSSSTAAGTIVQQSVCHTGQNQTWELVPLRYGWVQLRPTLDRFQCMTVDASNQLRLDGCSGRSEQSFALAMTRTSASLRLGTQCLDLPSFTTASGATPQLYGCKTTDSANQEWAFVPAAPGTFQLRSQSSGKCFDLRGGAYADGTIVEQVACTASTTQQWLVAPETASQFKLRNAAAGKCADFYGGALRIYTCGTSYPSQRFEVQPGHAGPALTVLPVGARILPTNTTLVGSLPIDPALAAPRITSGRTTSNSIVLAWTQSDPRTMHQLVTVWEIDPTSGYQTGVDQFHLPADHRGFWLGRIAGRSLVQGRRYDISLRAVSGTGLSADASSTRNFLVVPRITIERQTTPNEWTRVASTITGSFAVFDHDDDGVVDGAPGGDGVYPRGTGLVGGVPGSVPGTRYASTATHRANAVVGYTLLEGARRTFVAHHIHIDPLSGASRTIAVRYGDLDDGPTAKIWSVAAVWEGDVQVITGDGRATPNIVSGSVSTLGTAFDGSTRRIYFELYSALDPA